MIEEFVGEDFNAAKDKVDEKRRLLLRLGGWGILLGGLGLIKNFLPESLGTNSNHLDDKVQNYSLSSLEDPVLEELSFQSHQNPQSSSSGSQDNLQDNLQNYFQIRTEIKQRQRKFAQQYTEASSPKTKKEILKEARIYITDKIVNGLLPAWYGTPWEFSGVSQTPREGTISCGYFVGTILEHAGFKVDRIRIGQDYAENSIKYLTTDIRRSRKQDFREFVAESEARGPGLYVVGLDCHIGFIVQEKEKRLQFCHADYYQPEIGVRCQSIDERSPLADSKYRVVGKILDDQLIEKWILGEKI